MLSSNIKLLLRISMLTVCDETLYTCPQKSGGSKVATPGTGLVQQGRAISTPSVAMGNITFHGEANLTFQPPSPIAEVSTTQQRVNETGRLMCSV